jgi:hypothetical protein
MGFRNDVRNFMADVRAWMTSLAAMAALYQDVVARQKEEIKELREAFLARDLPELKTYETVLRQDGKFVPETAWSLQDEELAGSIAQVGESYGQIQPKT